MTYQPKIIYNITSNTASFLKPMSLANLLFWIAIPFVIITAYFGTRNGYYDSENYDGDGCAHDVKR